MITEKTETGVRFTIKRKNLRVHCFLQDKLEELAMITKGTTTEMQKIVENATKFITPQVEVKKDILISVDGMFYFDYQRKNGNWNISKIAKDSGTSRNSVYKYLGIKKGLQN